MVATPSQRGDFLRMCQTGSLTAATILSKRRSPAQITDEIDYYRHPGILPFVLWQLLRKKLIGFLSVSARFLQSVDEVTLWETGELFESRVRVP